MQPANQTIIIGVGNEYRGDDGAGLVVARKLRDRLNGDATVLELTGEFIALMDAWERASSVILIDAMQSGAAPGMICRFEAQKESLPQNAFRSSTHTFGVTEAIELARTLNRLPRQLILYGIEGKSFAPGKGLSAEVWEAVQEVVRQVLAEPYWR